MKTMKFRIKISYFILLAIFYGADCQVPEMPASLRDAVLDNNLVLKTMEAAVEMTGFESRTGLSPTDPYIGLGYLDGSPASIGNRVDFSVEQEFDFPGVYMNRSKAGKLKRDMGMLEYLQERQVQLTRARALWIQRTGLELSIALIQARLNDAQQLKSHYEKMVQEGEASQLALSQVSLQLVDLQSSLDDARSGLTQAELGLAEVCGGEVPVLGHTPLPSSREFNSDSLLARYMAAPAIKMKENQVRQREMERKIAAGKALPRFSAGYYSESVVNERFRGVNVGMSIPLWESRNTVKYSTAAISVASAELDRIRVEQRTRLLGKLDQREKLLQTIAAMENALEAVNGEELLANALEAGEISLSEYILTSEYYFSGMLKLIRYRTDLLLVENDLQKVYW